MGADTAALAVVHIYLHVSTTAVQTTLRAIDPAKVTVDAGRMIELWMECPETGIDRREATNAIACPEEHRVIGCRDVDITANFRLIHSLPPPFTKS